jgi:enoyl-CoA hydratase
MTTRAAQSSIGADAEPTVRYEVVGSTAVLTLNRPAAVNAINADMRRELPAGISRAVQDGEVRAILIRGAGDRGFCAGADITEFVAPDSLAAVRESKRPPSWADILADAPKPTIAAIHGYCLGGGLEMALACDVRVAAAGAVFGLPEVTLGIIPGAGGTQRLPRLVGVGHALELSLSGARIPAERALVIGLVSDVVPAHELAAAGLERAAGFASGAPLAVAHAKEAVNRGVEMSIADGLRLEADLSTLLHATLDRLEGATAFRERRRPRYQGR